MATTHADSQSHHRALVAVPRARRGGERAQSKGGILAGTAALVTAVGGTLGILVQVGVIHGSGSSGHASTNTASTSTTSGAPSNGATGLPSSGGTDSYGATTTEQTTGFSSQTSGSTSSSLLPVP